LPRNREISRLIEPWSFAQQRAMPCYSKAVGYH
jgi:hypothetical protein